MPITKFAGEFEFLSNFHPSPLEIDGIVFPTSEHAFQAMKTFDLEERQFVANQSTPGKAKRAGRKITLRPNWDHVRVEIMSQVVFEKFKQNEHLIDDLLATGDEELVEGNSWNDCFWGVCRGKGQNQLGKILMQIRSEFARIWPDDGE